jgi:replicative DNA helicase
MPKGAKGHAQHPAGDKPSLPQRGRRPKAEEILIHLMLKDEAVARSLKDQLQPGDFTDPLFRRAVQRIFDVLAATGSLDSRALAQEGEEELNRLFSYYAVLELEYDDPAKHCQDCVDSIKQQDPEKQMKRIVKALKEADLQGDTEEYKRLLEEQQQLCRRPGRRIPGM